MPIATLPTPTGLDFCAMGNFGPHNLHENRPGSFVSEETIFATYHNAGVRVFDIRDQYRAERDRVLGAADAGADARSAAARRAQRVDLRLLRDARRHHLRQRLERRACTCSSISASNFP